MRTSKTLSVSLPPAQLKRAERLAKRENRTLSELVTQAYGLAPADIDPFDRAALPRFAGKWHPISTALTTTRTRTRARLRSCEPNSCSLRPPDRQ